MRKEDILDKTSQGLEVFRRYVPGNWKIGKAFSSPLREDKHPSFSVFRDDHRIYRYKDHGTGITGNAIDFVMLMFSLDFVSACEKICSDFGLVDNLPLPRSKTQSQGSPKTKRFEPFELAFWEKYGISSELLERYGVSALLGSTQREPKFVFRYGNGVKLYQPFSQTRFLHYDREEDFVFGMEQLPDKGLYLFITGGEKDVLTLSAHGYYAICLNSETASITEELVSEYRKRFQYVMICYDMDATGIKMSTKAAKQNDQLIRIELPLDGLKGAKDVSDFFHIGHSKKEFDDIIKASVHKHFTALLKEVSQNRFDYNREIIEPTPVCSIEGNKILSLGNVIVVAGKPKAGKSAACQSVLSGSIATDSDKHNDCFLGIDTVHVPTGKMVLHFDTEQSLADYSKKLKSALWLAGYNDNAAQLESYHLLEYSPWERLRYIEHLIDYHALVSDGVYLVIIDGVADLVKSVNDEEACNEVVNTLHRVATEHNAAVLVVLHLNPDGGKTRGHLGSQLDRKAESVLNIEREGEICVINPKLCRNANVTSMPLQQFYWNDDLKRFVYDGAKSVFNAKDKKIAEYEDLLLELKAQEVLYDRSVLRTLISERLGKSRTTGYDIINFMISNQLLDELPDGRLKIL